MNYWRHTEMALGRWLPPSAKTVVEFGCESDRLQQGFTQVAPQASYFREEEAWCWERKQDCIHADCLVYGAEWFFQEGLLQRMAVQLRRSSENGQALFLIPYAGYWRVWQEMLQTGSASSYPQVSLEQVQDLLLRAGWHCQDVQLLQPDEGEANKERDAFFNSVRTAATPEALRKAQGIAFLVRACRIVPANLLIHTYMGETKPICARVRVVEPHRFLETKPGLFICNEYQTADLKKGDRFQRKIFIWQRGAPPEVETQKRLLARGYLILVEMDDDPAHWQNYRESDYMVFRTSHAVQVSTEALAETMRQYNPHVQVFENQMAMLPPKRENSSTGPVHLFFGALNREEDWKPYMVELNRVMVASGVDVCATVVHDRLFYDSLQLRDKEFRPFLPFEQYCAELYRSDIIFLPLLDNRFNRMKSDLKFLEAAAHGVAVLANPVVYESSIQNGKTGLIVRSPVEFAEKLTWLLRHPEERYSLRDNAYEWVKTNRMLSQHYTQRLAWYNFLLSSKEELTVQLLERMKRYEAGRSG